MIHSRKISGVAGKKKKKIDDDLPSPPRRIDELRNHVLKLAKDAKLFEKKFKAFDKTGISRDFLYLNWRFKELVEGWVEHYKYIEDTSQIGRVGKPANDGAKVLAKEYVDYYQKKAKDSTKYPTGQELQEFIEYQIELLRSKGEPAPKYVEVRTCSSWLTQMKRGKFRIKSLENLEDPWK